MGSLNFKKAFTMAEAILVMTILGIIATIMITTLKPAEYKDKGMAILAKKVLSEIDTATTMILMNDTPEGMIREFYKVDTKELYDIWHDDGIAQLLKLYKKYMTVTRKPCTSAAECGICASTPEGCTKMRASSFYLKDGACFQIAYCGNGGSVDTPTIFPEENIVSPVDAVWIFYTFDTNGLEEPNVLGKDQFRLPVGKYGIMYAGDGI